jgi:hypothetical protein
MAMGSTAQKPTQRKRFGELSEGLPGSTKSVAYIERNAQELGSPEWFLKQVGQFETSSRKANDPRESDQPIVLGDGRAVHMGKRLTGSRSLHRKPSPDM